MAVFQREQSQQEQKEPERMMDQTPMSVGDPIASAAAASVLFSWYQFYIKGDREYGIFVGLWAPTLLAAASYLQQKDIVRKFKKGLSSF